MSGVRRFFVDNVQDVTVVDGDEFNHAVNTLRLKVGDEVVLMDGSGFDYHATVTEINKKSFTAKTVSKSFNETECKNTVTLICGFLKGDKTELVVQKAVELGVKKIVVFDSEYSSAYMSDNKLQRLARVIKESVKQCGRSYLPTVEYAESFEKALSYGDNSDNKLFCCEFINEHSSDMKELTGSTAVVIGSEGGFSANEASLAFEKGYETINLGKRILRAETASIVAVSLVMFLLGELK